VRRAAVALALLAAGCGGGDDRLSEEEFRERANAVCADYDRQVEKLGEPSSVDEVEDFAAKAADLTRRGVGELRELEPPDELQPDYDRFLAEGQTVVELSDRLERAARDRDAEELQKILREAQASDRRSDQIAKRLGLDECAEDPG
jgi:hypothetical protein